MAARLLLIDGNSIGYASHHSKKLTNGDMEVQAIFGFLKTLQSLVRRNGNARPLVLWDAGSDFREELFPDYKAQRDVDPKKAAEREAYKAQVPFIEELLGYLGVDQAKTPGYEADDLAGFFVRKTNPSRDITLVTGDCDWQQLVNRPTVIWHDPRRDGKWCEFHTFEMVTGAKTPAEFVVDKAVLGDKSDNIGGIDGLGAKCVEAIKEHWGSIPNLLTHVARHGEISKANAPKGLNSRYIKPINRLCSKDGRDILFRNLGLMNLMSPSHDAIIKDHMILNRGTSDMDAFFKRCLEHNFHTITTRPKLWTDTFSKGD